MGKWSYRKAAQRAFPKMAECQNCGGKNRLQRHHPDKKKPIDIMILCQRCHTSEHLRTGTWGNHPKPIKVCIICNQNFKEYTHSRVKTCSRKCLSEIGRINALKRWRGEFVEDGSVASQELQKVRKKESTDLSV